MKNYYLLAMIIASLILIPQLSHSAPACSDGIDNDADGLIDYPSDPGCTSSASASELNPIMVGQWDTPWDTRTVFVKDKYAYMADGQSGLEIIDISDPHHPVLVGAYDSPDYAHCVHVTGDFAYLADGYSGLQIFDISNPALPSRVSYYDTPVDSRGDYIIGDLAYVGDQAESGLLIFDVSDPRKPVEINSLATGDRAGDVFVQGDYCYVANYTSGLEIINIADPYHPYHAGSYTSATVEAMYVKDDLAYLGARGQGLIILDVTDKSSPVKIGSYDTPGQSRGIWLSGNLIYLSDYNSGLQIINVSDPSHPTLAGTYDTPGQTWDVKVVGDYAYLADGTAGLIIIQIGNSDTDNDGMPNSWEIKHSCMNYLVADANADYDGDGLVNIEEMNHETDPCNSDTDGDQMPDGWEVEYNLDPLNNDADHDVDHDYLTNLQEYLNGTDPDNPDSDNGGEMDGPEVAGGRDPLNGYDDVVPPTNLQATPLDGAMVFLTWKASPSRTAVQYNIYWDAGTGPMNWATPLASVPAGSQLTYTTQPLTPGQTYKFGVRVQVSSGATDPNTTTVSVVPFYSNIGKVQACISHPHTGQKFNGNLLLVKAVICTGIEHDVKNVLFQWRTAGGTTWADIPPADNRPNPDPDSPYFIHWDVSRMPNGKYDLRAIATNLNNIADPDPEVSQFIIDYPNPEVQMNLDREGQPVACERVYTNVEASLDMVPSSQSAPDTVRLPETALLDNTTMILGAEQASAHEGTVDPVRFRTLHHFDRVTLDNGQSQLSNGKRAILTFSYLDSDNDGIVDGTAIKAEELRPCVWNAGQGEWQLLQNINLDKTAKTVSGSANHFSVFGLLAIYDNDIDGLENWEELALGTDLNKTDTDNDGISDGQEVHLTFTDPLNPDSDMDGLLDGEEVNIYGTDPNNNDTDADGIKDKEEINSGCMNPLQWAWDADGDALPDRFELDHGLNACNNLDGNNDLDNDKISNANEYWNRSRIGIPDPGGFGVTGDSRSYWADSGAGDGVMGPEDISVMRSLVAGDFSNMAALKFYNIIPTSGHTLDLDPDGVFTATDLSILRDMFAGRDCNYTGGMPSALELADPPLASVLIGYTTHIGVKVKAQASGKYMTGAAVVFAIDTIQSTGAATILGGDGPATDHPDYGKYRWDHAGKLNADASNVDPARVVIRIDAPGTIIINVSTPQVGISGQGRYMPYLELAPVSIKGEE